MPVDTPERLSHRQAKIEQRIFAELQREAPGEASFISQPFDWVHQWYPVAIAGDLDPGRHVLACCSPCFKVAFIASLPTHFHCGWRVAATQPLLSDPLA